MGAVIYTPMKNGKQSFVLFTVFRLIVEKEVAR